MTSKKDTLKNRVYAFHEKYCHKPKNFTLNHFAAEVVARSTLFDILKRKEDRISPERQKGSGRPAENMTLMCIFDH